MPKPKKVKQPKNKTFYSDGTFQELKKEIFFFVVVVVQNGGNTLKLVVKIERERVHSTHTVEKKIYAPSKMLAQLFAATWRVRLAR